jgi:hypothetical protein
LRDANIGMAISSRRASAHAAFGIKLDGDTAVTPREQAAFAAGIEIARQMALTAAVSIEVQMMPGLPASRP